MKKNLLLNIVTAFITFAAPAGLYAQFEGQPPSSGSSSEEKQIPPGFLFSIGPEISVPVNSFAGGGNWPVGVTLQGEYPIMLRQLYAVVNVGYFNLLNKNEDETGSYVQTIPFYGGVKYYVYKTLYAQVNLGASYLLNGDDITSTSSLSFAYAPQVGYTMVLNDRYFFDFALKYDGGSKFSGVTNQFIGVRVAFGLNVTGKSNWND